MSSHTLSRTASSCMSASQSSNTSAAGCSKNNNNKVKVHSPYAHHAIATTHNNALTEESYSSNSGASDSGDSGEMMPNPPTHLPHHHGYAPPDLISFPVFPPHAPQQQQTSAMMATTKGAPPPPPDYYACIGSSFPHEATPTGGVVGNGIKGAFHAKLEGQCEFIQPPPVPLVDQPTPVFSCPRLFLGQIRFETIPAEVRWILEYLTGVSPLKLETRGNGCFLVYFRTFEDMCRVKTLHKRVLFDQTGIWYARDEAQAEQLEKYVKENLGRSATKTVQPKGFRLPKDMMVVEEEKIHRQKQFIPFLPSSSTADYSSFGVQGVFPGVSNRSTNCNSSSQ